MKTTIPQKSKSHQAIINAIADIIKEVGKKKIAYIILFGSYARGDFFKDEIKQESDGTYLQYMSDYDFLVITNSNVPIVRQSAIELEKRIKDKIEEELLDKERPVSIIIEPLYRVNKDLKKGHYFFCDIKKEGILLYQNEKAKSLSEPKELTNEEKKELAENYYEDWMKNADNFYKKFQLMFSEKEYKSSAFDLHQVVESLYCCSHLVLTNYRPRTHDIEKLNKVLTYYSQEFINIFPQNSKEEKECFDLLKRAYVEARYNKDYSITKEQLEYLAAKVEKLKNITREVCKKKIESI